ncbi:MAG: vanadium-dependent haloperoxidase [Bacteroidetes bacterium]|nr:vanadium-dependent haloperoxidase [Bacteroidota bacterium]MDA1119823.1 vanadium-dependent haloperoxidase [Bacteroidota bacterium]
MKQIVFISFFISLFIGCEPVDYKPFTTDPELFQRSMKALTDVIVYDIFSPPVASRIYAYPSIAAYEALIPGYNGYQSMAGQLTDLELPPQPDKTKEISHEVAALKAFLVVGKTMIFSEDRIEAFEKKLWEEIEDSGIPSPVFNESIAYGEVVANHILAWADKDNYKQTRTFPKYTVKNEPYAWKPTPPDYAEGIEPSWNKIRLLILDSASQFVPPPPTPYDMDENSLFHREMMEVYDIGVNLDQEQEEIAKFWDCNPFVSHHSGHAMFATKKITPGGHWIGITAISTRQSQSNFMETAEAFSRVSISLFDAFIVCWDEKWRSILIRPETVINEFVDQDWAPLLQTPPFPEYTSGHSVISTAAATTLTDLFGEEFHFLDTTEVEYGMPPRSFTSFLNASSEAAISRIYGGIHYMPAITNGVDQGRDVGNFVVGNLKTKYSLPDQNASLINSEN